MTYSVKERKNELRKKFLSLRASFTKDEHIAMSGTINDLFLNSTEYKNAKTVLLYVSINSEVRTRTLIDRILLDGKRIALPVSFSEGKMVFRYIKDKKDLVKGRFSAPEPSAECEEYNGEAPAVCVIPAIAFDKKGYRLGYGGGYYDRYLKKYNLVRVGFCFDRLLVDSLPCGRFDTSCDMIITEKGIYYVDEKQ